MTTCKECHATIASNSKTCPHCGHRRASAASSVAFSVVIVALVIGFVLVVVFIGIPILFSHDLHAVKAHH